MRSPEEVGPRTATPTADSAGDVAAVCAAPSPTQERKPSPFDSGTTADLNRYIGMTLAEVAHRHDGQTVLAFRHRLNRAQGWHWIAIPTGDIEWWIGSTPDRPTSIRQPFHDSDWLQTQIDIGDDMYEQARYDDRDIDIAGNEHDNEFVRSWMTRGTR